MVEEGITTYDKHVLCWQNFHLLQDETGGKLGKRDRLLFPNLVVSRFGVTDDTDNGSPLLPPDSSPGA